MRLHVVRIAVAAATVLGVFVASPYATAAPHAKTRLAAETRVLGVPVSSTVSAAWSKQTQRSAKLVISGNNLPGTVSTVRASMTAPVNRTTKRFVWCISHNFDYVPLSPSDVGSFQVSAVVIHRDGTRRAYGGYGEPLTGMDPTRPQKSGGWGFRAFPQEPLRQGDLVTINIVVILDGPVGDTTQTLVARAC